MLVARGSRVLMWPRNSMVSGPVAPQAEEWAAISSFWSLSQMARFLTDCGIMSFAISVCSYWLVVFFEEKSRKALAVSGLWGGNAVLAGSESVSLAKVRALLGARVSRKSARHPRERRGDSRKSARVPLAREVRAFAAAVRALFWEMRAVAAGVRALRLAGAALGAAMQALVKAGAALGAGVRALARVVRDFSREVAVSG